MKNRRTFRDGRGKVIPLIRIFLHRTSLLAHLPVCNAYDELMISRDEYLFWRLWGRKAFSLRRPIIHDNNAVAAGNQFVYLQSNKTFAKERENPIPRSRWIINRSCCNHVFMDKEAILFWAWYIDIVPIFTFRWCRFIAINSFNCFFASGTDGIILHISRSSFSIGKTDLEV